MKNRVLAAILSVCILTSVPASRNEVSAASKQLNINTSFGVSETSVYGVPNGFTGRFSRIKGNVIGLYREAFGITLNFIVPNSGFVIESVADMCKSDSINGFDSLCDHCSASLCSNEGPFHCTNATVVKEDIFLSANNVRNAVQLHITATSLCAENNISHFGINGVCYPLSTDQCLIVRDYDYTLVDEPLINLTQYEVTMAQKTLAHEIGHLYGVEDHYSSIYDGDPNCIWGFNKDNENVASRLMVCSACRETINANANRYNHYS
ncbi:MAG: hypothetical protein E7500_05050 [Ruminococcus sp.]|nr:hypothetical protein [Ruminococcus sp.]